MKWPLGGTCYIISTFNWQFTKICTHIITDDSSHIITDYIMHIVSLRKSFVLHKPILVTISFVESKQAMMEKHEALKFICVIEVDLHGF